MGNHVIKSGESLQLSFGRNYSIRTAGKKTNWSKYYDVPKRPYALARKTLNSSTFQQFSALMTSSKNCLPVISVSSGFTYGWYFTTALTCGVQSLD